jgi:nucleoside phosphorylase
MRCAWSPEGFTYHHRRIFSERGSPMRVALAWTGAMGEVAAAARATSLIAHLKPACLAMCGICAGDRRDVFLGDVIVADRVYSYDHGKLVASTDEHDQRHEQIFHDIETYNLDATSVAPWPSPTGQASSTAT